MYGCALLKEKGYGKVYCTDVRQERLVLVPRFSGIPINSCMLFSLHNTPLMYFPIKTIFLLMDADEYKSNMPTDLVTGIHFLQEQDYQVPGSGNAVDPGGYFVHYRFFEGAETDLQPV